MVKKISSYLFLFVILGIGLVSLWAYQRYFKTEEAIFLEFRAERGSIKEVIKARGEIAPQKDFDLKFLSSGIVEEIFVSEGESVEFGAPLVKLDTTDLELELKKLQNELNQGRSDLAIRQSESQNVSTNLSAVTEKQDTLVANAYRTLLSEGLIAEPIDEDNTMTAPIITGKYDGLEGAYTFRVDKKRPTDTDYILYVFGLEKTGPIAVKKTGPTALGTKGLFVDFPEDIESYYDESWSLNIPNTKSSVYSQNLNAYQQAIRERNRAIEEAKAQLSNQDIGGFSIADAKVAQAQAQIKILQSQILIVEDQIKKSTLYAPASVKIEKIPLEVGELAQPGSSAVNLETPGFKIQTDISELDIPKIRENDGQDVEIKLDAFPGVVIMGKVLSVEPREVVKEGDKYYRVNIYIDPQDINIRSGMSVDTRILISSKDNIIKIPELAIYEKNDDQFVLIRTNNGNQEIGIQTGISDGESVEIVQGLSEGDIVVVSAD